MRKITTLFILLAGITTASYSQTKRIAHRSHSGTDKTFSINGVDNFGIAYPHPKVAIREKTDTARKIAPPKKDSTSKPDAPKPVNPPYVRKSPARNPKTKS